MFFELVNKLRVKIQFHRLNFKDGLKYGFQYFRKKHVKSLRITDEISCLKRIISK
jgi:hypothetical protein